MTEFLEDGILEEEIEEEVVVNESDSYVPVYSDENTSGNGVKVLHTSPLNPGHDYFIGVDTGSTGKDFAIMAEINFQNGPTGDNGVNGVTNESLLAILINRTEFLNEAFPSKDNEDALHHLRGALVSFEKRILERKERGVYGKNVE